ncbi:MAG: transglycosylase SLT domain-containing protein [Thermodesulfobacteriota bacterium]|nr:transglycosylase SLT domain-containing protein [Thermodesulfobacteriota bacterium]
MRRLLFFLCILAAGCTTSDRTTQKTPMSHPFPSLISNVQTIEPLDFCGEPVDLDKRDIRERMEKELLITIWDRAQVALWIKRSTRYFPLIEEMLKKEDMPEDLKYVAVAESALRPHVRSTKGAIGFWQFIKATGKKFDLQIDSNKDERRNIFTSTKAAIAYFKELYSIFGSWTLSAAAYNMGEQGLQSEILAQRCNNFYDLYLPFETQRFIFRIVSAKLILSDPEKYGFTFTKEDLYPPIEFDRIKLTCNQTTPIDIIAQAANTTFKAIKDLNTEIRGHYIAAGSHSILIPKGSSMDFHSRLKTFSDQWLANNNEHVYVVKKGDNLSKIAKRFKVPLPALMIWNRLNLNKHIHPGDRLIIYPNGIESEDENL